MIGQHLNLFLILRNPLLTLPLIPLYQIGLMLDLVQSEEDTFVLAFHVDYEEVPD